MIIRPLQEIPIHHSQIPFTIVLLISRLWVPSSAGYWRQLYYTAVFYMCIIQYITFFVPNQSECMYRTFTTKLFTWSFTWLNHLWSVNWHIPEFCFESWTLLSFESSTWNVIQVSSRRSTQPHQWYLHLRFLSCRSLSSLFKHYLFHPVSLYLTQ